MLSNVAYKKNIVILSGLLVYKPFLNQGKMKPYVSFLLAQQSVKKTKEVFYRYFKVMSFEPSVIEFIEKTTTQCIVECQAHLNLYTEDDMVKQVVICDKIVAIKQYALPFKLKGGINESDYIIKQEHPVADEELSELEEKMKRLK
jgi:hypothetical protein